MLTDEERQEIVKEMARYPDRRAASIEALKIVQRHRRWLSDDALDDIGAFLAISTDELDGIATFYNLIFRQPVGRHVILCCDSVTCWLMGFAKIVDALRSNLGIDLGETTKDGRFTLLPNVCLGACDHAPVLMIDDDCYRDFAPEQIDNILSRYD